jgi:hypothetical protein
MTQDEMIALQTKAGLPPGWDPNFHSVMIEGRNFRALLKGRLEISAAYSESKPGKLCIQTDSGDIWIEDQVLIFNDGLRAERELCFGRGRK